jgi:predicted amidohydrolase
MSKLNIGGLQLSLDNTNSGIDHNNFDIIEHEIDLAMTRFPWLDMLVLSELVSYGVKAIYAQKKNSSVEKFFSQLAKKHQVWIIPGSYLEKSGTKVFNTTPIINPEGKIISRYRKIYPFLPYESNITAGDKFVVFEVPNIGKLGVVICYDQWFPEVCRTLTWLGAETIICPTLTNTIDRPKELILAQANAITNQCYFVNINATGHSAYGQSVVFGPEGEIIYQANTGQELITVELDFNRVRHVRERGLHGLCQNLKSFRDNPIEFPVYKKTAGDGELKKLGKLELPTANTKLD